MKFRTRGILHSGDDDDISIFMSFSSLGLSFRGRSCDLTLARTNNDGIMYVRVHTNYTYRARYAFEPLFHITSYVEIVRLI